MSSSEEETCTQKLIGDLETIYSDKDIYSIIGEEHNQKNSLSNQNAFDSEINLITDVGLTFLQNKRTRYSKPSCEPNTDGNAISTAQLYYHNGYKEMIETDPKKIVFTTSIKDKEIKEINKIKRSIKDYLSDAFTKIKELKKFMAKSWKEIFQTYKISFNYSNSMKLMKMTPSDFVENLFSGNCKNNRKEIITPMNIDEAKIIEKGLREIFTKEKYKDIHIIDGLDEFINIKADNLNMPEEQNICIEISEDKSEKNASKDLNIEIKIDNRIGTIFKTVKSKTNQRQIKEFNKVSGKNQLPEKISDYLDNITNKSSDLLFMENSFKDNLLYFIKGSEKKENEENEENKENKELIKAIINAVEEEKNEKAIKILEMKTFEFIERIMSCEKEKKECLKEDEEREINFIKNKKCKNLYHDLETKLPPSDLIKIEKCVKKGDKRIEDAEGFRKEVNKLKGYENFTLELTEKEKEKVEERKMILENLAENPMIYLYLIAPRKSTPKTKKPKKQNKKAKK